jgi:hypothetical protein
LSNPKKIELALLQKFTKEETNELNDKLSDYGIENTTLVIKHNLAGNLDFKK